MRLNHFTSDTPAGGAATYPVDETKLTQDFYDAVNGQWAEHAEIPGDHSSTGGFMDLVDNIEHTLMADFAYLLTGKRTPANPEMAEFKKLYTLARNFAKREQDGTAPLKPFLDKVAGLKDFDDLNAHLAEWY